MGCKPLTNKFFYPLEIIHSKKKATEQKKRIKLYPFGLEHKGYNNVVNGTENNYKTFQGKEKEEELGRNTYDFGWRDFDPAIARWTNLDPLAEAYISSSPYVFTANNPIYNIEVDGRYFEGKNEKRAARIERRAEKRAAKLNKRADKRAAKGKSVGDLRDRATELTQSAQDIKDMRNDTSTEYRYGKVNSKEAKALNLQGPATLSTGQNKKGDDVVSIFTEGNMGSRLHETRHGGQNARGEFDIKTGNNYGVADEVSAYRAQYSWKGKLDYVPFTNFNSQANLTKLLTQGISGFKVNVTNINQINPTMVNSLVDNPGLNQILIYPPKDASGNPVIPLSTWNSN
jgi:RHS repeat-associated protein